MEEFHEKWGEKYPQILYNVYLKYIALEVLHVYSIDEVFMDVTDYLHTINLSTRELAMKIILDVLNTIGITATAGIGTNLNLCKVAMDIEARQIVFSVRLASATLTA